MFPFWLALAKKHQTWCLWISLTSCQYGSCIIVFGEDSCCSQPQLWGKARPSENMQTNISIASGAGRRQGAYEYRFSWKIQHCQLWGTTAGMNKQLYAKRVLQWSVLPEHFQATMFQHLLKRKRFLPTPSIFCTEFGIMGLSGVVISAFCLTFFLPSAAEWVCLILTKKTAHVAFRWGHQKQNGGKRI